MTCARWSVLALVMLAAPPARAQSTSAQAQSAFDDGRKQMDAGKFAEACTAFETSQKLEPRITTLLNLADCREQNHQLATASSLFADANRMARAAGDARLAQVAANHVRKLEPRLSRLTISVPADRRVTELEVLRGTEPLDPSSWNRALPVDGGSYTITARAPGREPWSTTRVIKTEGDTQKVEIPRLVEVKPAPPPAVARGGSPAPPSKVAAATVGATPGSPAGAPTDALRDDGSAAVDARTEPAASAPSVAARSDALASTEGPVSDRPSLVPPIALGAGALVLGGVALYFNHAGDTSYDKAKTAASPVEQSSNYNAANHRRYAAEAFGAAAVGCAGVAVWLYVRSRSESGPSATAMTPVVAPGLAGVAVVGSW